MLNPSADAFILFQQIEDLQPPFWEPPALRPEDDPEESRGRSGEPIDQVESLCEPHWSPEERIDFILMYIEEHLREELPIRRLAQYCGMSLSYFRASFLLKTRLTPGRYIRNLRYRRAADILSVERLTIREVMRRVGITDKSHFMRDFKACFGITPGNYHRFQARRRASQKALIDEAGKASEPSSAMG